MMGFGKQHNSLSRFFGYEQRVRDLQHLWLSEFWWCWDILPSYDSFSGLGISVSVWLRRASSLSVAQKQTNTFRTQRYLGVAWGRGSSDGDHDAVVEERDVRHVERDQFRPPKRTGKSDHLQLVRAQPNGVLGCTDVIIVSSRGRRAAPSRNRRLVPRNPRLPFTAVMRQTKPARLCPRARWSHPRLTMRPCDRVPIRIKGRRAACS